MPVRAVTFRRTHWRTNTSANKLRSAGTRVSLSRLLTSSSCSLTPGNRPAFLFFSKGGAAANKHLESPGSKQLHSIGAVLSTSTLPYRLTYLDSVTSQLLLKQHRSQRRKRPILLWPGVRIVAPLQWDGLRQISSWRIEGRIWWSHLASGAIHHPLSLPLFLHLCQGRGMRREREGFLLAAVVSWGCVAMARKFKLQLCNYRSVNKDASPIFKYTQVEANKNTETGP